MQSARVQLPITPMLDMTFQLLFFFIVNFHPADLEGQVEMALPAADDGRSGCGCPPQGRDPEAALPTELTVRAIAQGGADSDGKVTALNARILEGKEVVVRVDPALKHLSNFLTDMRPTLNNKDAITVLADGRLRVGQLIAIMDVCRKAGFTRLSLAPPAEQ